MSDEEWREMPEEHQELVDRAVEGVRRDFVTAARRLAADCAEFAEIRVVEGEDEALATSLRWAAQRLVDLADRSDREHGSRPWEPPTDPDSDPVHRRLY